MVKFLQEQVKTKFFSGDQRTVKANRNSLYSLLLRGGSIAIGLILVPMTIKFVNPVQYGIWLTLSSIIGWFNFFDVGLGNGLKNKLAESNAKEDFKTSKIYVSTTYGIIAILSVLILALFLVANKFVNWNEVLNVTDVSNAELRLLALLLVGIFCFQFIFQLLNTVLTACHEPAKVSVITLIGQVLCLILISIFSIKGEGSLMLLVAVIGGVPLLVFCVANFWFYSRSYKYISPSFKSVDFKYGKQLLLVGGAFFIIQMGQLVLFQTDNIILTQLFGPSQVTVFNLAYKLFSVILIIFSVGITPYWSAFTDAYFKKDFEWIRSTFNKLIKGWLLTIVLSIVLVIVSPFIFHLWLKDLVIIPIQLSISMAFYVIASSFHMLCCFLLNGIGKIRMQLYLYMICLFCNIPLSILLGKYIGVAGVTYSNGIVLGLMGAVLYYQCSKILNNTAKGIWNQ